MKILITGGAGFIGSNVADAYIAAGHKVSIVDNLSTGKRENINPRATFYNADLREKDVLEGIFKMEQPDMVNHHAAQIDVRKSVADPHFDAQTNIMGLLNLLDCCLVCKVKKFINISSGGAIYGENAALPYNEKSDKDPLSPYGISKLTAEHYVRFYSRIHGLDYTTLRYSNVYGMRQDPKGEAGVIAIFSSLMMEKKQPSIFGDGKQTRDYVFVKDVVSANMAALDKGSCEAFNIGTAKETSVNQLFLSLKSALGYKESPIYQPARPGEVARSCLDITKAKESLGWKPAYNLESGIKETVKWLKKKN